MSEHAAAQARNRDADEKTKATAPGSNPRTGVTICVILNWVTKGRNVAEVTVATKGKRVDVGMTGIVLGLGGKYAVTSVSGGAAKGLLEVDNVAKELPEHPFMAIDPSDILRENNDALAAKPHDHRRR